MQSTTKLNFTLRNTLLVFSLAFFFCFLTNTKAFGATEIFPTFGDYTVEQLNIGATCNTSSYIKLRNTNYPVGIGDDCQNTSVCLSYSAGVSNPELIMPLEYLDSYWTKYQPFFGTVTCDSSDENLYGYYFYYTPTSSITSFVISTSTKMSTSTGIMNTGDTLEFYQVCNTTGFSQNYSAIIATSTGAYTANHQFNDCTSGTATSTVNDGGSFFNVISRYNGTIRTVLDSVIIYISSSGAYTPLGLDGFASSTLDYVPGDYNCSVTNPLGCLQQALEWAFIPSRVATEKFFTFQTLLSSKAPTGYFYVVKNNLLNLSSTSTPAFSLVIPASIKTYIFNPFDIAIGSILWLFFAVHFYKRLKTITV